MVRDHWTWINAPGIAVVAESGLPEKSDQFQFLLLPQVGTGVDAQRVYLLGRNLPDAEEAFDGEFCDESIDLPGQDDEQSVEFSVIRGDLR